MSTKNTASLLTELSSDDERMSDKSGPSKEPEGTSVLVFGHFIYPLHAYSKITIWI